MKTAVVIGAGWAGLSCAAELADRGFEVRLLEQSGRLGGRASSFQDEKSGTVVDNGQHLFMGCYTHTFGFLKKIGTFEKLKFQKDLSVDFVSSAGKISTLHCGSLPSPLHLASGLLGLDTLSFREKIAMLRVYWAASRRLRPSTNGKSVEEWLKGLGQSDNSRKHFWDLITLATLNEQPAIAEAGALAVVLKEALFTSREKSQVAIATVGLSELLGPSSKKYLEERKGRIEPNTLVAKINAVGDSVRGIVLRDGKTVTGDVYVSAVPFFVLKNLLAGDSMRTPFFSNLKLLQSSPIFSISLWFDRPVTDREFVGMLDTKVQWLFNKGKILSLPGPKSYISLVISGAHEFLGMTNEALLAMCLEDVKLCFPEARTARLLHSLIQREKNATLSPRVGVEDYRPSQKTPIKNFFVCGDWTKTGFPATIESAAASGVLAAQAAA